MRILVTLFLLVGIGAGHYYLNEIQIEDFKTMRVIPLAALSGLGLFGSIFLSLQSEGRRLRKICAIQVSLVALASLATLAVILLQTSAHSTKPILSPTIMLYGNTYAFIFLLYPLELMRPGWLTIRRAVLLFLPILILGGLYFIITRLKGTSIQEIHNWSELTSNIAKFDVWFRFTIFIYPVWLFARTLRYKKIYNRWCEDNCSTKENSSLNLLENYNIGFFLILSSYIIVMLVNNPQCRILHSLLFVIFTGYLLYQNIFNIQPVIEQSRLPFYDKKTQDEPAVESTVTHTDAEQRRFSDKIPQYKEMLEQWMEAEKPYKNPRFKLLDCMSVLPLNRSYLSRLFNEGYNETFFTFVMRYRIDEGARLLDAHPDLTVACISEMCGFSSPSVFGRAFLKHKGFTPLQYRRKHNRLDKVS